MNSDAPPNLEGFTDFRIAREIAAELSELGPDQLRSISGEDVRLLCKAVPELAEFMLKACA